MATFDARLHMAAFESMERGEKTVYAVPSNDQFRSICSGDRLEFGSFGSITVGMVRRYGDLEQLVATEGWSNLVPGAASPDEAVRQVRSAEEWDGSSEQAEGVLSLRVRDVRRKT